MKGVNHCREEGAMSRFYHFIYGGKYRSFNILSTFAIIIATGAFPGAFANSPSSYSSLLGDKDGFGFGMQEGDIRPASIFDNREPDDPFFTDTWSVPTEGFYPSVHFSYTQSFSPPLDTVISAELSMFTLGISDGDSQVVGSDTDIQLFLDDVELPGAFDDVDQFDFYTDVGWAEEAGLITIEIPEEIFAHFADGELVVKFEIHQLGTAPSVDGFSIDYSEVIFHYESETTMPSLFRSHLIGAEEVPPVDTHTKAWAEFELNDAETELRFGALVRNVVDATSVHIHCGAEGENGPPGVTLFDDGPVSVEEERFESEIDAPDPGNACGWANLTALIAAMRSGHTYLNVHTLAHPNGEIRGQIEPVPPALPDLIIAHLAFSPKTPDTTDTIRIRALVKNVGDGVSDASTLLLKIGDEPGETYGIPRLEPGEHYPVFRQEVLTTPGEYQITATADADHEVSEEDEGNNVATDFITVLPPPEPRLFGAELTGDEVVPPVDTDARAWIEFELNPAETRLSFRALVREIVDATAARIHCGHASENGPVGITIYENSPVSIEEEHFEGVITDPDPGNACGWADLAAVVDAMRSDQAYASIATLEHPEVEIRGQVEPVLP